MAVTYTDVCDVGDWLRTCIGCCTTPSKAQVEKIINYNEELIDRRTGHTYGRTKSSTEIFPLHLLYVFGHGTYITLKHREIKTCSCDNLHFCACAGDKIEIWNGASGTYSNATCCHGVYDVEPIKGDVYIRGFIFTILRTDRIKITYRYGSSCVPDDIRKACVLLTARDIVKSSLKMDDVAFGGAIDKEKAMSDWEEEADRIIKNREEVYVLP